MSFSFSNFEAFSKHLIIETKESGLRPLYPLLGTQVHLFNELKRGFDDGIRHFVILKGRQAAVTTGCLALDLYWLFIHGGLHGAMISDNEKNRDQNRAYLTNYMNGLPPEYKIPVNGHNRNQLLLANRSRLMYQIAGGRGGSNTGRGSGLALAHGTECSSWANEQALDSLNASLAQKNPNRLYLFESTALGHNVWLEMSEAAKTATSQRFIFIGWWLHDDYRVSRETLQFKTYWTGRLDAHERDWVTQVKKLYGFEVQPEQIAWWRWQLFEYFHEDLTALTQEYPPCVTSETRVGTEQGIIRIADAVNGMRATNGTVIDTHANAATTIYKLTTKLGYKLRATWDHPIFTPGGVLITLRGSEGQRIALQPPMMAEKEAVVRWSDGPINGEIRITPSMGRLIGVFMGDGSFAVKGRGKNRRTGCGTLSIACDAQDQDLVEGLMLLVRNIFGVEPTVRRTGTKKGCSDIRANSTVLTQVFDRLGVLRNDTGNTRRRVHVPEFIFQSPREVVKEFLSGLFEADGFNDYKGARVVLYSMYREFLEDVQVLLLGFGITCRLISQKRHNKTHEYMANEITLRSNEARKFNEEIGFLSPRKRARYDAQASSDHPLSFQIVMEDEVVSVVEDGFEPVYNLTIENEHAFDANGIKTHNTEHMAFVVAGSQWFNAGALTEAWNTAKALDFSAYAYHFGDAFTSTIIWEAKPAKADLRVWEKPAKSNASYIVAADPAYGDSENADRFVVQVLRCYADRLDQVAEYCVDDIDTYKFAWVICHLAGYYAGSGNQITLTVEVNGPGRATIDEIRNLRRQAYTIRDQEQGTDIKAAVRHMSWYLYRRNDSLTGPTHFIGQVTSHELKQRMMNVLRDCVHRKLANVRSLGLIDEMRTIIRKPDGDVKGDGRAKDDRVMAAGQAAVVWMEQVRPRLESMRHTFEAAQAAEKGQQYSMMDVVKENYFKNKVADLKVAEFLKNARPGAKVKA